MRMIVISAVALMLAACEHMYGGMDAGRLGPTVAGEADRTGLVRIAMRKLARGHVTPGGTPKVVDAGPTWRVYFSSDEPDVLDGGVTVEIDKKSRRAVRYWFDS